MEGKIKRNKLFIRYNPKLKELARNLRKNSTLSEILLWRYLKGGKIQGYDFHRQKPIENYIVDFYCEELRLAIEIDGITHTDKEVKDKLRQKELEKIGIKFLRFTDGNVRHSCWAVALEIEEQVKKMIGISGHANTPRPDGHPSRGETQRRKNLKIK